MSPRLCYRVGAELLASEMRPWPSMSAQARLDSLQCVGNSQIQMVQQGRQFGVQFVSNNRHSPIDETTELIAGLVDSEERLPIRTAPYRGVQWCIHHH